MIDNHLIENRHIRVFISSTFQDMQDERDYLMKRTFPKLRKLASERDVTLTELDLRWGITEEESKSGKVVEICFREIENSIPFFIGIIGNRYGWVPKEEELGEKVTERYPAVRDYVNRQLSVTEMEMQFGVLERKEDMNAYFYIKDDEDEKQDNPEMLERLKKAVSDSRYPSSSYSTVDDLAQQVEQAFTTLLDKLFPVGNISELEKERIGQRSFMNQLCQNYIKDKKNFEVLDSWLADEDSHQFVVTGESGLGKSALIANWVKEKLVDNGFEYNIIYHFTGNGGSESSSEHITRSIVNEIMDIYGWKDDEFGSEKKLEDLFLKVSSEGDKPLLLVIDAINQIVDVDNAKLLNWLPVPTREIKILFSTLEDDRTMEVFKHRAYPVFTLQPLDIERRSQMVRSYLKLYAKSLTDKQVHRIATDSQCENTLVLKTLLDELIYFGIYEKLDERIDYYLASETINDFYQLLLQSYEEEFREYGDNFVKNILSIIAVSRNGLSEEDIISIAEIKPLHWSQFYCQFYSNTTNINGLITLCHTYVQNAIDNRYHEEMHLYQNKICLYFENNKSKHSLTELPYQYFNLRNENALYSFLENPQNFMFLYQFSIYELKIYWKFMLESSNRSFYAYIKNNDIVSEDLYFCKALTSFYINEICNHSTFGYSGNPTISAYFAKKMLSKEIDINDKIFGLRMYVASLIGALRTYSAGSKTSMKEVVDDKIKIAINELTDVLTSQNISNSEKSAAYKILGQYYIGRNHPIAIEYLRKSLDYACANSLESYHTQIILSNLEIGNNELDSARQRLYNIINEITNRFSYFSIINSDALMSLSWLCKKEGKYNDSIQCLLNIVKIYDFLLDDSDSRYEDVYNRLSDLYSLNGDEELSDHYRDKLWECWHVGGNPDQRSHLAFRFDNLDLIHERYNENVNIEEWTKTSLNIYLEVYGKNNIETAESYNNLAVIQGSNGRLEEAEDSINKAIKIAKRKNFKTNYNVDTDLLLRLSFNKAYLFMLKHNYDDAIHEFNCYINNVKKSPYSGVIGVETSYDCLGDIYLEEKCYDMSLESYRSGLKARKKTPIPFDIGVSLYKIGTVYYKMRKNNIASRLFKKSVLLMEKDGFSNHYQYVDCIIQLCKLKFVCHKSKEADFIYKRAYKKITVLKFKNKLKKEYKNLLLHTR